MKYWSIVALCVLSIGCSTEKSAEGDGLYNQGKYAEAIAAYDAYLEYHPGDLEVIYNKGRAFEALNNFDQALKNYEIVLAMDGRHILSLQSIGQYHYRKKDYNNAFFFFDKAVNVDRDNSLSHYLKGNANQKLGKVKDALKDYNAAISVNKNYGQAYLARGTARIILKQKSSACNDFILAKNLEIEEAGKALKKYCK